MISAVSHWMSRASSYSLLKKKNLIFWMDLPVLELCDDQMTDYMHHSRSSVHHGQVYLKDDTAELIYGINSGRFSVYM